MPDTIQAPAEELEELHNVQNEVKQLVELVGKLELATYVHKEEITDAKVRFRGLVIREREMIKKLKEKYGSAEVEMITSFVV